VQRRGRIASARRVPRAVRFQSVPTFCRHNRLIQNCPICSREQGLEGRPLVSGLPAAPSSGAAPRRSRTTTARSPGASAGMRVRRLARGLDDGYRCALVPGLRSSEDAARFADELAFASWRLESLSRDPPGLFAEVAQAGADVEERTWLMFLIAYLSPLEDDDPFAEIRRVRTSWRSGSLPELEGVRTGPRSAHEPAAGLRTLAAYRAWAQRAGSQAAAYGGEPGWSGERRFARAYERLGLPGLHRGARFELLIALGALGLYELSPSVLELGGGDPVTIAAKRIFGIGERMLLERRAAAFAQAAGVPLAALDVAMWAWERGERAGLGVPSQAPADHGNLQAARKALEL
jgi:hypothetical protein